VAFILLFGDCRPRRDRNCQKSTVEPTDPLVNSAGMVNVVSTTVLLMAVPRN
jgi:hypothetical protein